MLDVPRFIRGHCSGLPITVSGGLGATGKHELGCSGLSLSVPRFMHCVSGIENDFFFLVFKQFYLCLY
jgi:hypothetical protein